MFVFFIHAEYSQIQLDCDFNHMINNTTYINHMIKTKMKFCYERGPGGPGRSVVQVGWQHHYLSVDNCLWTVIHTQSYRYNYYIGTLFANSPPNICACVSFYHTLVLSQITQSCVFYGEFNLTVCVTATHDGSPNISPPTAQSRRQMHKCAAVSPKLLMCVVTWDD